MRKRKMKEKWIAMFLCAATAAGLLAGCGNTDAAEQASAEASDTVELTAPGELPIVNEKIELSALVVQLPYKLTDVKTNEFTIELEDMTNVHLNMTVVPQDSYQEKLNLLLASGDYPDIIMSGGFSNADLVKYGSEEKILIPLNDLIEEQGYYIKERFEEFPNLKSDMTAPDGNIYGIPGNIGGSVGHEAVGYKMWINTKWLENLGLEKPTTTEEFYQVLKAFKEQDANGNGDPNDEIPLTGATGTWAGEPYLFLLNAFGYYTTDAVMLKDGKMYPTANTEAMKEGLEYIHKLYEEGLIDPAAFTQNESQLSAVGNNEGSNIVGAASCGHIGMAVSINDEERMSEFTALEPLEGPNGYRGIPFTEELRFSGATYVITDKCEYPEVAFRLADTLMKEDVALRSCIGQKGKYWDDADEGTFGSDGVTPARYKYLQMVAGNDGTTANDLWELTCCLVMPKDWKTWFQVEGSIYDPNNYEARLLQETEKLRPYAADVDQIPPFYMNDEDSTALAQISSPLQDYIKQSIIEFITGKKDIESGWEEYLAGLSNLKYEEYVNLYQKAYDELSQQ